MSECIEIKGTSIKLGTCEDLYYVRYEELERVVASGVTKKLDGNAEPGDYLKLDYFRYRFPFLEEDGQEWTEWMKRDYDKGVVVGVPRAMVDMDHDDIWHSINVDGAYNVNLAMPCPASKAFQGLTSSPLPEHFPLAIKQQRRIDCELWVVVACGWCDHKVRLGASEASALACHLEDYTLCRPNDYWREISRRILAGYKRSPKVR